MGAKERYLRFERMKEALAKSAYDSGKMNLGEIWPIHPIEAYPYFIDLFFHFLNKKIEFVRKEHMRINPSTIWGWLINIILGDKIVHINKKELIRLVNKLLDLLEGSMSGNCFCEDYTHRIMDIDQYWTQTNSFTDCKKKEMLKLHAELMFYNQTLHWVVNCAFREVHGPYNVIFNNKPAQLIIREYLSLVSPTNDLSVNYVKSETVYDKNINFKFLVLNDFFWDKKIEDHMLDSKCNFDGKEIVDTEDISEFNGILSKANEEESKRVISLSRDKKIIGLAERFYKTINDKNPPVQVPINIIEERIRTLKLKLPKQVLDRETAKMLFDPTK